MWSAGTSALPPAGQPGTVQACQCCVSLEEYVAARKEITGAFKPQNFVFDKILSIVASVDGIDYYYINDKLLSPIAKKSEVYVNQGEMVEIAKKQLQQSFNDINASEFSN